MTEARTIKGSPFAWVDKRMLRRIREQCREMASAIGTYLALAVTASDNGVETVTVTHSGLAALAGLSEKTVRERLKELAQAGAITIYTPPLKAACTYTLLPFGNGCRTSGNGHRALGSGEAPPLPNTNMKKEEPRSVALTVGERIGMEKSRAIIQEQVDRLKDATFYEHDRTPENMAKLADLQSRLAGIDRRLTEAAT